MKLGLFSLFLFLVFTNHAFAQKSKNEIMADVLKARDLQLPGLGMIILSYEDNKHVVASKTGRYIIKGTLQDHWDGVQSSGNSKTTYPQFPSMLKVDDFAIKMGNPDGKEVISFVSYSCEGCPSLIKQLLNPEYLALHNVILIPVHNTPEDKIIAQQIYCAEDPTKAFETLYLNRDVASLSNPCKHPQPDINVSLANALKVSALPATYVKGTGVVRFGPF